MLKQQGVSSSLFQGIMSVARDALLFLFYRIGKLKKCNSRVHRVGYYKVNLTVVEGLNSFIFFSLQFSN